MVRAAFFFFFAVLISACSTTQEKQPASRVQDPYYIRVIPISNPQVDRESFRIRLGFEIYSDVELKRKALVQEIRQVVTYERKNGRDSMRELQLVEAFKLRLLRVTEDNQYVYTLLRGQSDSHRMYDFWNDDKQVRSIRIKREVFAYVASVRGADFTDLGFAMLPENESGTMKTEVSHRFNQSYQAEHQTSGIVMDSEVHHGLAYRIQYRVTKDHKKAPHFRLDRAWGRGVVEDEVEHFWRGN
ncbi:MAG: hypothetical protein ACYTDT_13300 [Planctomycetota bacterium]|jgi:hypothetical protein